MKKRKVKFLQDESGRSEKMKEAGESGVLEKVKKKKNEKVLNGNFEGSGKVKKKKDKMKKGGALEHVLPMQTKKKSKTKLLDAVPDSSKKKKKKVSDGNSDISEKKKKKEKPKRDKSEKIAKREKGAPQLKREKQPATEEPVPEISLVDEDSSRGMKKWIMEYHQRRPGLDVIQERINDFIASYEAEQEQARREREARDVEEGWTTVLHHKGRKKTADSESGVAVGSISQAAVEAKVAKKKREDLALDFYRFQKREAQRNELLMLQSKFEQDKKRLHQLRAARKFRPY